MITCPKCGQTSHNANDERERYCGNCHQFYDGIRGESSNIEVLLTGVDDLHCFKLVFQAKSESPDSQRTPVEIYLHTTQAIDLFCKLAVKLAEYMNQASAELLEMKTAQFRKLRHMMDPEL